MKRTRTSAEEVEAGECFLHGLPEEMQAEVRQWLGRDDPASRAMLAMTCRHEAARLPPPRTVTRDLHLVASAPRPGTDTC